MKYILQYWPLSALVVQSSKSKLLVTLFQQFRGNCGLIAGVDSWKLIGIADTTTAFISGNVQGYTKPTDTTIIEPLAFATLRFKRLSDSVSVQVDTDIKGLFKTWLDPGLYVMYVGYVGFSPLEVQNLLIKSGELIESTAILGTRYGQTQYYMNEVGTFVKLSK